MVRRTFCGSGRAQRGFTLVELLVVISIIGTLVALLLPAVQMAREAARRNTCINNQHNISVAMQNYTGARKMYPGYRDVIQTNVGQLPVSWATAMMPYMDQRQVFDQWKSLLGSANMSMMTIPMLESLKCPSDVTAEQLSTPLSYVVNCGQADLTPLNGSSGGQPSSSSSLVTSNPPIPPDYAANGMFMSRWDYNWLSANKLNQLPRNTDDTVRDGKSNTLLVTENLDAKNWYDEVTLGDPSNPSTYATTNSSNGYQTAPNPASATLTAGNQTAPKFLTPEAYTGFVWWPYQVSPSFVTNINGPSSEIGYATDMFQARPSSNHPGIVVVSYADGRTQTVSENIDYKIFCLLMTPDGAKCNPAGVQFYLSNDTTNLPWQYTSSSSSNFPATTGGFRNSVISSVDIQ